MQTTTRRALPYAQGTDDPNVYPQQVDQPAKAALDVAVGVTRGTLVDLPTSPIDDDEYYATDTQQYFKWNGSAWVTFSPALVTSLPGSPYPGQEVYLEVDSTNGVVWHLRYTASFAGNHPWLMLGGADLQASNVSGGTVTSNGTWEPTPNFPTLTIPTTGIYDVRWGAAFGGTTFQSYIWNCGVFVNGQSLPFDSISLASANQAGATTAGMVTGEPREALTAGNELILGAYYVSGGPSGNPAPQPEISDQLIRARPVRLG